jgi:23S rRNA (adenine2503-C2)-methyltransferase
MKEVLLGKTLDELCALTAQVGMPRFTAKQIAQWLYAKRVTSIDEMTNLSLKNRALLKELYEVGTEKPIDEQRSTDGTVKYLYSAGEGLTIEAVYIPEGERATLCVSSQVGCKMNCKFCMTGKMGFKKSLTAGQILNQIIALPEYDKLTNIVMMGMGEPLDNLDEVLKALTIMTASYGFAWSPKRITLSTCGLRKGLRRFIEESDCHLAISLHSPVPQQRAEMMPAERAYSITEIVELLRNYDFSKQRRLSFEYILFKGKERFGGLCQRAATITARSGLPRQPHPFPCHSRRTFRRSGRREDGMVQRLSDEARTLCIHPRLPRRRYLCCMRYALDSEE